MGIMVERLRSILALVAPFVPRKPTLPVIAGVLFADGKAIATNLEQAVSVQVPEAAEPILIPKGISQVLDYVGGKNMLEIKMEGNSLMVDCESTKAIVHTMDPLEFPPMPEFTELHSGEVDGDIFLRGLTSVAPYAAQDEKRPVLATVCITLGEALEVAAADGFTLAWEELTTSLPVPDGTRTILLRTAAVKNLAFLWKHAPKDLPEMDGDSPIALVAVARRPLRLAFAEKQVSFAFGNVQMISELVEGKFPSYRSLIPKEEPSKVHFDAQTMLRALGSLMTSNEIVRLEWADTTMMLKAREEGVLEIERSIPVRTEGPEGRIGFKYGYLMRYLTGKDGVVTLGTTTPNQPGVFSYQGHPHVLIMPMMVHSEEQPATKDNDGQEEKTDVRRSDSSVAAGVRPKKRRPR